MWRQAETPPRRKLHIELEELESAFQHPFAEIHYYLDLQTGRVIMLTDEVRCELEDIYQEIYNEDGTESIPLDTALQQRELSEWMTEAVQEAHHIVTDHGSRYFRVPPRDPSEGYRDVEAFIASLQDQRLQAHLAQTVRSRGAFRRFMEVLAADPTEEARWFAFKAKRERQRLLDWLESEGIEPLMEPPSEMQASVQLASLRPQLIAEVLTFVPAVRGLRGITRIGLIGSLTTDKPGPKDVDLLVTVTDDADLAPLAALGRKLQGHAQSLGRGGEVFLADPGGHYLGRTCPWKRCGPGIRMSCDALHCGVRPYLHDDLQTIRLIQTLIAAPPIELWPQVIARLPLPQDLQAGLIAPLRSEEGSLSEREE